MRYIIYVCIALLVSCANSSENDTVVETTETPEKVTANAKFKKESSERLDYLIQNLSLSDKLITIVSTEKNLYDEAMLNPLTNHKLLPTSRSKAVNLGVYGADLNYLIRFEQSQLSVRYLLASKYLSEQIGIAMAFDKDKLDEFQSNLEHADSLIAIVYRAYEEVKKGLQNEEQFLLSTLVVSGSWIENMYISTTLFPRVQNKAVQDQIIENLKNQVIYLSKISELLKTLNEGDSIFVNEFLEKLAKIQSVYDGIKDNNLTAKHVAQLQKEFDVLRLSLIEIK